MGHKKKRVVFLAWAMAVARFISAQGPEVDIERALQLLMENGPFGQAQFFKDIESAWPGALPILKKNIRHTDPIVRESIVKSLRFNGASCAEVGRALGKSLQDDVRKVRYESVYSLSDLGCKAQTKAIKALINSEKEQDVLNIAVSSLGNLGGPAEFSYLKTIEQDTSKPLDTRLHATYALTKLNGPYDPELIEEGLNGNGQSPVMALRALGKTGDKNLYEKLSPKINQLKQSTPLETEAVYAEKGVNLYAPSQSTQQQEEYLFSLMGDDDPVVRAWAALKITDDFQTPSNVERLTEIATDQNKIGNEEALHALLRKKLKSQEELLNLISKKQENSQ